MPQPLIFPSSIPVDRAIQAAFLVGVARTTYRTQKAHTKHMRHLLMGLAGVSFLTFTVSLFYHQYALLLPSFAALPLLFLVRNSRWARRPEAARLRFSMMRHALLERNYDEVIALGIDSQVVKVSKFQALFPTEEDQPQDIKHGALELA